MRRRRPPATPPENVVLVYDDGRRIPVDCVYLGWHDGAHLWEVASVGVMDPPDRLSIDRLPAMTSVRLWVSA